MNHLEEITKASKLKRIGTNACLFTILALFVAIVVLLTDDWMADSSLTELLGKLCMGVLFFLPFQIAIPCAALILFRKTGKIGQVHALALLIPYILLSIVFWLFAPGEAKKDAQGALIFLFGPIYISIICCAFLGVFSVVYLIYRKIKTNPDQN